MINDVKLDSVASSVISNSQNNAQDEATQQIVNQESSTAVTKNLSTFAHSLTSDVPTLPSDIMRMESIKSQIKQGTYVVDQNALSEKLYNHFFTKPMSE